MTEYLILSLNRAIPLVWEYNRQITFNLTFTRTYGNIPQSTIVRQANGYSSSYFRLDSTAKRVFRIFKTPPQPSVTGVTRISKPKLYRVGFSLSALMGSPRFRIDLHYVNPDDTPGEYITSFTPSVSSDTVYLDWGNPPSAFSGYELDWDTKYALVLVPTVADENNRANIYYIPLSTDPLPPCKIGYSIDNGVTWTLITGTYDWWSNWSGIGYASVGIAFYYESEVTIPMAKSSEAFRSYFNG
jgi:hypothetical protein